MVEQRGMVGTTCSPRSPTLGIQRGEVVAQTASQCFDISVWQMLAALLVGGRVEILRDEVAHDPSRLSLRGRVQRRDDSRDGTVALAGVLVEDVGTRGKGPALRALRWMIPTGEAMPPDLCALWLASYPHVPLVNAYGPTECSDDVTHHRMDAPPTDGIVPIGRPVQNMRLYVLDERMHPVPRGAVGELYVGGIGVGRGYLRDPRRTATAFVPDPFGGEVDARLYRTGDLGRHRSDGTLEFFGRGDAQVKVRGYRIELGGDRGGLCARPRGCAGRGRRRTRRRDGEKRLDSANVVRRAEEVGAASLRAQRSSNGCPAEYMVPVSFVFLEAIPLFGEREGRPACSSRSLPPAEGLPNRRTSRHARSRRCAWPRWSPRS